MATLPYVPGGTRHGKGAPQIQAGDVYGPYDSQNWNCGMAGNRESFAWALEPGTIGDGPCITVETAGGTVLFYMNNGDCGGASCCPMNPVETESWQIAVAWVQTDNPFTVTATVERNEAGFLYDPGTETCWAAVDPVTIGLTGTIVSAGTVNGAAVAQQSGESPTQTACCPHSLVAAVLAVGGVWIGVWTVTFTINEQAPPP